MRFLALCMLSAALVVLTGGAWAQDSNGDDRATKEEAGGHVATFEIVERSESDREGVDLRVLVEVDGIESPDLVLVGPGGTLLRETGADGSADPGDLLDGRGRQR